MVKLEEIAPVIAKTLGVEVNSITIDSSMADFQDWDSLGHLTIISALDDALGDRYRESEALASAESVKDILEALNS